MGKWLEKKSNWLGNKNRNNDEPRPKSLGRPVNDSEDYGVTYTPLRCPKCKSKKVRCYSSNLPVRYHVCRECGYNFKSIEADG